MRLRSITILALAGLLATFVLQAQPNKYGVPLITNYPYYETRGTEQNYCITQDHRGVVYVGNIDKGILEFDGAEWRTIPVPNDAIVMSLATGDDGVVYVGSAGEFGRLEPDAGGSLYYHSLCDSTIRVQIPKFDIWRTFFDDNKVYFCAGPVIFVYHTIEDQVQIGSHCSIYSISLYRILN